MTALGWFSAGAASAVAMRLALRTAPDLHVVYIDPGSEHVDNQRFRLDVERWLGVPVTVERSDRYIDTWQVWTDKRFIIGPHGAPCTLALKKQVRQRIEADFDRQVFGYTVEEQGRADRFRGQNPDVDLWCPLIDAGLSKADCLGMIQRAGIVLPAMYLLGYRNNNCVGCPKGGMGYWNMIRRDFPATFDRMAVLERELDHSVSHDDSGPVWLDELDPTRGDIWTEPVIDCSLLCVIAEVD